MGLVQVGFLGALVALAIPIIIHLVFGWRVRRVDLGTLRFLKIVLRENVRRRRLKRWLLLALRITCLTLLAFLFARPYLAARQWGGGNQLLVILLDRSASMGLKTGGGRLFELALREAKKVAGRCGDEAHVEIALFDQGVHPAVAGYGFGTYPPTRVGDQAAGGHPEGTRKGAPAGALAALDRLAADLAPTGVSYSATNYEAALAWAADVCGQSDRPRKELYVFTDLQRSGLTATQLQPLPAEVDVHLVDLGQVFAANTAVTRVTPNRLTVRPGEPVTLTASLLNAGQFPLKGVPVVLRLRSHGRPAVEGYGIRTSPPTREVRGTVDLEAGATATLQFELQDLAEGLWQGHVAAELDDDLPFDNQRHVALMVAHPLPVILVDGDPGQSLLTAETYFLEASLRLAHSPTEGGHQAELGPAESFVDSPFEPSRVVLGEQAGLGDLRACALVVLANVGGLPADDLRRLGEFVRRGGGLLVFCGDQVGRQGCRALQQEGLSAGEFAGTATADHPADGARIAWRLDAWEADHPIFGPFNDPQYGDLRRLAFRVHTIVKPQEDARVLARFRGGRPALIERPLGRGKILWFVSACDRDWSDWPRSRLYLPMIHQMLGYLAGLTEGGPVRNVLLGAAPKATGYGICTDLPPRGAAEPVPGVVDRGRFHEVINADPRESELDRCTREEFAARLKLKLPRAEVPSPGRDVGQAAAVAQTRPDEIWHWLMLPLVALLLCEGLLANRTIA